MSGFNPGKQIPLAAVALRVRQVRNQVLGGDLFSDPAWDILLTLRFEGPQSAGGLARLVGLSEAVVARWVKLLVERQLIESDAGDSLKLAKAAAGDLDRIFDAGRSVLELDA